MNNSWTSPSPSGNSVGFERSTRLPRFFFQLCFLFFVGMSRPRSKCSTWWSTTAILASYARSSTGSAWPLWRTTRCRQFLKWRSTILIWTSITPWATRTTPPASTTTWWCSRKAEAMPANDVADPCCLGPRRIAPNPRFHSSSSLFFFIKFLLFGLIRILRRCKTLSNRLLDLFQSSNRVGIYFVIWRIAGRPSTAKRGRRKTGSAAAAAAVTRTERTPTTKSSSSWSEQRPETRSLPSSATGRSTSKRATHPFHWSKSCFRTSHRQW